MMTIPNKLYFRIGEVATLLTVKPYVLRYWETEFQDIKPSKSKSGQRLYKRRDVELLTMIKSLLYEERFTINGARKRLKELIREHRGNDHQSQISLALDSAAHRETIPLTLVTNSNVASLNPPKKEGVESTLKNRPSEPQQGMDNKKVFSKIKRDLESILEDLKV